MTFRIGRVWGRFHHRVARRLTGRQPWRVRDELWLYPLLEYAMAEAGFQEVETYVSCHQNTVAHFIATRPSMDLCLVQPPCAALRRRGRHRLRWGYGGCRRGAPGAPRPVPPGGAGGWSAFTRDAKNKALPEGGQRLKSTNSIDQDQVITRRRTVHRTR